MPSEPWTAREIRRALWAAYGAKWAVLFEVTARPEGSYAEKIRAAGSDEEIEAVRAGHRERRIDVLLVRRSQVSPAPAAEPAPAPPVDLGLLVGLDLPVAEPPPLRGDPGGDDGGLERTALEIKTSRADFLRDVARPEKQGPWRELANRHAFVVPEGLVRPDEVPAGSGLLVVSRHGAPATSGWHEVRWARRAPWTAARRPLPLPNILDAFYRAGRAEAAAAGLGARRGDTTEDLRLRLQQAEHDLRLAEERVGRLHSRAEALARQLAVAQPPACVTCGRPLRPARGYVWRHDPADEAACEPQRAAAEDARVAAADGGVGAELAADPAFRLGGRFFRTPGPEPVEPNLDTACASS